MPLPVDEDLPTKFPTPDYLTLSSFKRGVITIVDKSNLPKNAMQEADNLYLVEDGQPAQRPGVDWYGSAISTTSRVNPVVTTNLITNPSFEVDLTSWTLHVGQTGGTQTRITSDFNTGTASLQLQTGVNNQGTTYAVTGLTVGQYYAVSAYIKTAQTYFMSASYTGSSSVSGTGTGTWQRISIVGLATGTSGTILISTFLPSQTILIDSVQFEVGTQSSDYLDGSLLDTADTDYVWTGSANASTSTRTTYTLIAAQIDGYDYFDAGGEIHLVAAVGGSIYRSLDNAQTWDLCSGTNYTAGSPALMNQNNSFLHITTGLDNIIRYDGTTTLQEYVALTTPAAPTIVRTGLSGTNFTVYYRYSAVNEVGFSIASTNVSQAVSLQRDSWDSTTNFLTLTLPPPQATQTRGDIYYSEDNLNYYYLDSIISSVATPNVTYKDDGTAVVVPSTLAPEESTSQGPKVAELVNVGSRMYGVRDPDNRYRIWFTSGSPPFGAFSSGYDGGYLDWQPGGKYLPVQVADYRDGKGTPLATIWCDSADGQGCVLQMSLDAVTQDGITVTVPSAFKLPGSRGTPAAGSVVNVLNDYMFYNSQAVYNLGSRAQFLNLLSTDESSANIRPTVQTISTANESKIASAYFNAKVLFSAPFGSDENNITMVYDTERKAWLPTAFTVGFKRFLRYTSTETDGSKVNRLLALKPGDNRLSEIAVSIKGDYGVPFRTSLLTGLYPTNKNRFEFQFTEEAEFELSQPSGLINIELLGYERAHGYGLIKSKSYNFSTGITDVGWDVSAWDTFPWDDTADVPTIVSNSSEKKYFTVQKELNSVQWHLTTNTLDAGYILRTLQTWGTPTEGGHPSGWRVT